MQSDKNPSVGTEYPIPDDKLSAAVYIPYEQEYKPEHFPISEKHRVSILRKSNPAMSSRSFQAWLFPKAWS